MNTRHARGTPCRKKSLNPPHLGVIKGKVRLCDSIFAFLSGIYESYETYILPLGTNSTPGTRYRVPLVVVGPPILLPALFKKFIKLSILYIYYFCWYIIIDHGRGVISYKYKKYNFSIN